VPFPVAFRLKGKRGHLSDGGYSSMMVKRRLHVEVNPTMLLTVQRTNVSPRLYTDPRAGEQEMLGSGPTSSETKMGNDSTLAERAPVLVPSVRALGQ
jgi:hypothetical protein